MYAGLIKSRVLREKSGEKRVRAFLGNQDQDEVGERGSEIGENTSD